MTFGAGLVLFLLVCIVFFAVGSNPALEASTAPIEEATPPQPAPPPQPELRELQKLVQPGETISALLGDYFTPQEILALNQDSRKVYPFTKICAGQPYRICTTDGEFTKFIYEIDDEEELVISREAGQTRMEREPIQYDVTTALVRGTIKTSLFDAVSEIGEEPELAIALADIFAWDIDFILDLRVGDTFQALVEKRSREGQPAGYGNILAAEFINQNKTFRAVRYEDEKGRASYYNEAGENVRKAFLRAPLNFTRISSGFTMKRFHPITKTWKAHPAIDYAAPTGTPIHTVGDGTISRIGRTRGNGNFVEVRHSNGYKTLYLHMSKFARGMSLGKRVTQGQTIGYVGSTGLATGPHLCFRMKKNGAPVNPLHVKVAAAKAIPKQKMAEFTAYATPLLARLDDAAAAAELAQNRVDEADLPPGVPVLEKAQ